MVDRTVIRYSESFKLQVVREMEAGKHGSCAGAAEAYGIRGGGTVQSWLDKYGGEQSRRKVIRVETTKERDELKRLKGRIRELEQALSDATLDLRLEREYVKLACGRAGIGDVDEFKKKAFGNRCTGR
jgi:transposase-like protein